MSNNKLRVVGSYLSPYVRKVLVCLELKGLDYEIDPIIPYYGDVEFSRLSPLRRIPLLMDGDLCIADSTIICEYLDEKYPDTPLYPKDLAMRAKARWLEEYADSRMGEVFIWHYYNQLVIKRFVWGQEPDQYVLQEATEEEIPYIMDYLESTMPKEGFVFGQISIADIALAAFFRNLFFARYSMDDRRWPITSSYVNRMHAQPAFKNLMQFEEITLRTPIGEHRKALLELGAPLTATSYGTSTPSRGIFKT